MSVDGMKILVTGASSGIGAHIVQFLAGAGAEVVAAARRLEQLEALAAGSDRIHPLRMDVTDAASVAEGTAKAAEMMGGLSGLFANAGISRGVPAIRMSDEDWDDQIEINLNGVFRCCRDAARIMARNGGGAILATSSIVGLRPGMGVAAYAASKAGVAHLVKALALEWAPMKIRVNAIAPGYFPTEMTSGFLLSEKGAKLAAGVPMGRFGDPAELEGPVELLLGSRGSFITGATLPVDGGHLCQSV
jgi:NAD(P)-dependent dehydrogenase (short-subunit alcohol dehydrogenase family)